MENEIQFIVDGLAESLGRSVVVEEPGFKPLSVSAHYGALDPVRIDSLLQRRTEGRLISFFRSRGINAASAPVRIPALPELDLLPRLVLPIRVRGSLLGHMWLIDHDPPVDEAEIREAERAAQAIGEVLWRDARVTDHDLQAEVSLLESVLDGGARQRRGRFAQLVHAKRMDGDASGFRMSVIRARPPETTSSGSHALRSSLYDFLREIRDSAGIHPFTGLVRHSHLLGLMQVHGDASKDRASLIRVIRAAAARCELGVEAIGIGGRFDDADELGRSLDQAAYAARIASRCAELKGAAGWDELGALRIFYGVEWTEAGVETLHPGTLTLLRDPRSSLPATLMTYLEQGGDAQRTAAALHIHRTTLYYRLSRIEELLGHDLEDGDARFTLHAALRLAGLIGMRPMRPGRAQADH